MTPFEVRPRARAVWVGLVLLGHAGLWLAAGIGRAPVPAPPSAQWAPALVWLAAARPPDPEPPEPERAALARARPAPSAAPSAQPPRPGKPWPGLLYTPTPMPTPAQAPATPPAADAIVAGMAAASPPPVASAPPRLMLDLPRRASPLADTPAARAAQAARGDETGPPLREQRLAQALGTDTRLHETARGDVRRFRQGRHCVDLRPSREAGLNPFSQSAQAVPRQAEPC